MVFKSDKINRLTKSINDWNGKTTNCNIIYLVQVISKESYSAYTKLRFKGYTQTIQ